MEVVLNKERYKLFEYSKHSELILRKGNHEYTLFFFAGFNEAASKYVYLFKYFFERMHDLKVKVVIPYLPTYKSTDEEMKPFLEGKTPKNENFSLNSWFYFEGKIRDEDGNYLYKTNEKTDKYILNLISKEIKILGNTEKIIFGAFSQGGVYLMRIILENLKIKTLFNVIFKSPVFHYENKKKENSKNLVFNSNHFHLYYSRFEKVLPFDFCIKSYQKFKDQFEHVFVSYDNNKHHVVNQECLDFFEKLLISYIKGKEIVKF